MFRLHWKRLFPLCCAIALGTIILCRLYKSSKSDLFTEAATVAKAIRPLLKPGEVLCLNITSAEPYTYPYLRYHLAPQPVYQFSKKLTYPSLQVLPLNAFFIKGADSALIRWQMQGQYYAYRLLSPE